MISSLAQTGPIARASTVRLQAELVRAQQELASGRHYDIGRSIGARAIAVSSIQGRISDGQAIIDGNKIATARLSASGAALESIMGIAQSMQQRLLDAGSGTTDAKTLQEAGASALSQTIAIANTAFDGVYLFAGLNDGAKPLNDYLPGSASGPSGRLIQVFHGGLGGQPGDQGNAAIAASEMQSFLETTFAQMFEPDQWKEYWSRASDIGAEVRVSENASLRYPAAGNSVALREVVKSLTMVAGLGLPTLNADAQRVVIDQASTILGNALGAFSALTAQVGIGQNRIEAASQDLSLQQVQLTTRLNDLESVDPAEVAARISTLSDQLQASYQVTAKLAHLSLVNYI